MKKHFIYLALVLIGCNYPEGKQSQVILTMGNSSFERQKVDIALEIGDSKFIDTLYFDRVIDKKISVPAGTHIIKIKSTLGNVNYESKFKVDSVVYVDVRYNFGKTREELRALELVKQHNNLDTAYFAGDKKENDLPRITFEISRDPFKYQ